MLLSSAVTAAQESVLTVGYIDSGNLWLWQSEDAVPRQLAEGQIVQMFPSAEGDLIAFTRWETQPGQAESLAWLNVAEGSEQTIVVLDATAETRIVDVVWAGDQLFFSLAEMTALGLVLRYDLWRYTAGDEAAEQVLEPGAGGQAHVSPDGRWLGVVSPGVYGGEAGWIRLFRVVDSTVREGLRFPAVSSGATYGFLPDIQWEADSTAFRIALPDKDLLYATDNLPLTVIWHIPVDGAPVELGTVSASLFGQPRWSGSGRHLAYFQPVGSTRDNQFALMLADGNGAAAGVYMRGSAGTIGLPVWMPGSEQFIYEQGNAGAYWLGAAGSAPQAFPEARFNVQGVDATSYVYASAPGGSFELRVGQIGQSESTLVAAVENPVPVFVAWFAG
jgi:hypothetical protein